VCQVFERVYRVKLKAHWLGSLDKLKQR